MGQEWKEIIAVVHRYEENGLDAPPSNMRFEPVRTENKEAKGSGINMTK